MILTQFCARQYIVLFTEDALELLMRSNPPRFAFDTKYNFAEELVGRFNQRIPLVSSCQQGQRLTCLEPHIFIK